MVLGSATAAHAIDLQGGQFEFVLQKPDGNGGFVDMSDDEKEEFFNIANCACNTEFAYRITLLGIPQVELPNTEVEVWVGSNCGDIDTEPPRDCGRDDTGADCRCERIRVIDDINSFKSETRITIDARDFMFPGQPFCLLDTATRNLYLLIDEDGDNRPDEQQFKPDNDKFIDTEPPPLPLNVTVQPGEGGALIEWDLPGSDDQDLRSFQVMCGRIDGEAIDLDEDPAFEDPEQVCPELFSSMVLPAMSIPATPATVYHGGPGVDAGVPDAGVGDPDAGTGDPEFVDLTGLVACTGEIANTDTSVRVNGLENDVGYRMVLVVIDDRLNRNPFGVELGVVTPVPALDFWEDYKDRGGNADGGFCFVATAAYGDYDHPFVRVLRDFRDETLASTGVGRWLIRTYYDNSPPMARFIERHPVAAWLARLVLAPVVLFAGLWVYSGVLGKLGLFAVLGLLVAWRRIRKARRAALPASETNERRPRRLRRAVAVTAAGVLVLVALGASAHAQPYWDEPGGPADQASASRSHELRSEWAFDLKFGPYLPDIDAEFSLTPMDGDPACLSEGPYNCMFGGGGLMTMMELDRFFLYPSGQLGIGVGLGWFKETANAYVIADDGRPEIDDDGKLVRSEGDETTFRILPVWVNAVYRFTNLDDEIGIPLVPYGKIGVSYYIWSIARPDGEISSVPDDPMCTAEDCNQNKARGASLGWQGTLGIALRAERLDKKMAQSLRSELGIEHSGFFVEMTMAKVDGFGADDKLTLGDTTWFAGINFEF